jgi:hypothetical protein
MQVELATVFKEEKPFTPSKPWKVKIQADKARGIKGSIMGPWKTKSAAQRWADGFNNLEWRVSE